MESEQNSPAAWLFFFIYFLDQYPLFSRPLPLPLPQTFGLSKCEGKEFSPQCGGGSGGRRGSEKKQNFLTASFYSQLLDSTGDGGQGGGKGYVLTSRTRPRALLMGKDKA